MMNRRAFLVTTVGLLAAAPLAAEAQQAGKGYRLGWLGTIPPSPADPAWEAFITGLREHGYVVGQNIVIEQRYAEGREDRFPGFVDEFIRMRVDVILATSIQAARAAQAATTSVPIVMVGLLDPERTGLVTSLGHPGGNVTGLSNQLLELQSKQFQLFKEFLPRLARLGVLWSPANEASALAWRETEGQIKALGMTTISGPIGPPAELEPTLDAVSARRPDGLYIHLIMLPYQKRIIEFALSHRLPTFVSSRRWADAGALMTYGPNTPDILRRSAGYVDKILKGAKPGDLPIQQPTKFEFVINMRTAKALGLTIPASLLARADEVIQ